MSYFMVRLTPCRMIEWIMNSCQLFEIGKLQCFDLRPFGRRYSQRCTSVHFISVFHCNVWTDETCRINYNNRGGLWSVFDWIQSEFLHQSADYLLKEVKTQFLHWKRGQFLLLTSDQLEELKANVYHIFGLCDFLRFYDQFFGVLIGWQVSSYFHWSSIRVHCVRSHKYFPVGYIRRKRRERAKCKRRLSPGGKQIFGSPFASRVLRTWSCILLARLPLGTRHAA